MNIPIYDKVTFHHEPTRTKLLLHKREINRLFGYVKKKVIL